MKIDMSNVKTTVTHRNEQGYTVYENKNEKDDPVNSPQHYKQHKFESIDEMEILFGKEAVIGFCICNAWKYRERAPYKGKYEEDNAKADWYLTKAKELQEKE